MANVLCPPCPIAFETRVFACQYSGRLDSQIDRDVLFLGSYEPSVLDLLAHLAAERTRPILLDVGANVGHHSLFAAGHYAEVHAFEPYPPLVAVLRAHVSRNSLAHVHVHPVGLGEVDRDAWYSAPADNRAGYGGFHVHDPVLEKHVLPLRRGDVYVRAAGIARVDVVKIDVEGGERQVIEGLRHVLIEDRPALVMEYWPESWPDGVQRALGDYRLWSLEEQGTVLGVFCRTRWSLRPIEAASPGSTVVALPEGWAVPAERVAGR